MKAEVTLDVLSPLFVDRIISRRANVVWQPRSCDLTPLDYYLWGAVKDKCYPNKRETIDALKNNICEALGEIQLHTIDNVFLKIALSAAELRSFGHLGALIWTICRVPSKISVTL